MTAGQWANGLLVMLATGAIGYWVLWLLSRASLYPVYVIIYGTAVVLGYQTTARVGLFWNLEHGQFPFLWFICYVLQSSSTRKTHLTPEQVWWVSTAMSVSLYFVCRMLRRCCCPGGGRSSGRRRPRTSS